MCSNSLQLAVVSAADRQICSQEAGLRTGWL